MKLFLKKAIVFLFLINLWQLSIAQITITGTITDPDGLPLIGASVIEKGTVNGTVTNMDGKYSLQVANKESILVFSFIGYETLEQIVGDRTEISLQLLLNMEELSEVMVVGYGVQKKSDITGAIVSVKSEELEKSISTNISSSLQGKTAGVQVTQNSGSPGSLPKIRIRGVGTITDASPLYVVDGFPTSNIEYINPNDVASVEILKDASASAIYGARGANGVILITTKKGEKGKGKLTYNGYYATQAIPKQLDILSGPEYYQVMKTMYENAGKTFSLLSEAGNYPGVAWAGDTTHTTNWYDELVQTALMKTHDLSFSGGTEKVSYLLSGSLVDQEGTVIGSSYGRKTFRTNIDAQLKPWLDVGTNFTMSHNEKTYVTEGSMYYGTVLNTLRADPLTPIYNDSLDLYYNPAYQDVENPVAAIKNKNYVKDYLRTVGGAYVSFKPIDGLVVKSTISVDIDNTKSKNFIPEQYFIGTDKNDRPYNTITESHSKYGSWLNENTIVYSKTLNLHDFSVLAGFTRQKWSSEWMTAEKDSLPGENEALWYFDPATGEARIYGNAAYSSMESLLGRVNYSYAGKYLFTANIRRDGSSKFGSKNRYGFFPSFSLGWNILKEDFIPDIPTLNTLKLRIGWGQIGNDKIGNNAYSANVSFDAYNSYILGGNNASQYQVWGAAPDNFGNPFIKWETVESWNLGLDFAMLENRISGSAELYVKKSKDMLVKNPVPQYTGFISNPYTNAGEMENKGIELNITYKDSYGDLNYNITGNLTINKNKITYLGQEGQPITAGSIQAGSISLNEVGYPVGSFYGYITNGLFQDSASVANQTVQPNAVPGDLIYVDLNGDGQITDADRTHIGSPLPKFTYGLNLNAEYKGFDLSLFLQGSYGNKIFNATNWYLLHTSEKYNRSAKILESWNGPGSTNEYPRLSTSDYNKNNLISDRYIEDGSYLRIKNIQLGYSLPQKYLTKIFVEQLRVYIGAQNLLTFTKYSGLDPEIGNLYSDLSAGIDLGTYPQPKTMQIGVKIVF